MCIDSFCILCVYFTCVIHTTLFRLDCVSCTKSKYRRACCEVANDNTIFPPRTIGIETTTSRKPVRSLFSHYDVGACAW